MTEENKCIFCGIVDGSMQSAKIYEDELVVCVLDIFPASKGHVLVIPKKHIAVSLYFICALRLCRIIRPSRSKN